MKTREALKRAIHGEPDEDDKGDGLPIGLARNPEGIKFHCPECEYYDAGICQYDDPRLKGVKVDADECCNRFEHEGMETLVK
jgi:hypothetical protein